jgi:hypothetical protein
MIITRENQCEHCLYQSEDDETGEPYCSLNLDQDDVESIISDKATSCPYFRMGDDYSIVRKQGF